MKRATVRNAMVLRSRLSGGGVIPWQFPTGHGNAFTSVPPNNNRDVLQSKPDYHVLNRGADNWGLPQLEDQIQFVPDRDAVLTQGGDRGLTCSCCIDGSRPQRLQSKATPLVESQRIQVIVRGSQPKHFKPFQPIYNRSKEC